jgi:hypothetical protein
MTIDVPNTWWAVVLLWLAIVAPIGIALLRRVKHLWAVVGLVLATFLFAWAWLGALALAVFDKTQKDSALRPVHKDV